MSKIYIIACFSIVIFASSCVTPGKFASLEHEKSKLEMTLAQTQHELHQLEEDKAQLKFSQRQLKEQVEDMTNKLMSTESEVESLKIEIEGKNQVIEMLSDDITMDLGVSENVIEEKPLEFVHKTALGFVQSVSINEPVNEYAYYKNDLSLNFYSGSDQVTQEDFSYLKEIATQFLSNPQVHYLIEGHSDHLPLRSTARFKDNWELSKKRSEAVAQVLVEMGVNPDQFTVVGKSDTEPLIKGDHLTKEDLAKNRRVEIIAQVDLDQQLINTNTISSIGVASS